MTVIMHYDDHQTDCHGVDDQIHDHQKHIMVLMIINKIVMSLLMIIKNIVMLLMIILMITKKIVMALLMIIKNIVMLLMIRV